MRTEIWEKTKRLTACVLAASMFLSLSACGNGSDNADQGGNAQSGQDSAQQAGGSGPDGGASGSDTADGGEEDAGVTVDDTVSVATIYEAVKEAYGEDYMPDTMLAEDEIQAMYGIDPEWCEEVIADMSMISIHVDTFIAVKAKEEYLSNVSDAINAYLDTLKADTMQYPSNQNKIAAATVVTMGNYVFFIMLGNISNEEDMEEDAVQIELYAKRNQVAVDAIESVLLK